MKDIHAIQTRYRGYRFRSRLEARWAVFFDALGIPWEYEKQGYVLQSGECYLPDFWLPGSDDCPPRMWLEVKGEMPGEYWLPTEPEEKMVQLCKITRRCGVVAFGLPSRDIRICEVSCYPDLRPAPFVHRWIGLNAIFGWCQKDGIDEAIADARSARFEFGEEGAPR